MTNENCHSTLKGAGNDSENPEKLRCNMSNIINITDAAIMHIKTIIHKNNAIAFRLSVKEAGCNGLRYVPEVVSQPRDGDIELQLGDIRVLVDQKSVQYLQGTTVDVLAKELQQKQLVFNNPNTKSACGCGESFNVEEANNA